MKAHRNADDIDYALVDTALGWIGVAFTGRGLRFLALPRVTEEAAESAVLDACPNALRTDRPPGELEDRLRRYALGEAVEFPDAVDLAGTSGFSQRVWEITRSIRRGETRSYLWLAEQAGSPRGARAAGRAMATNPVPIVIPCHRVVGSNGSLHGFGGGLELKARMLALEARTGQLAFVGA
jgi:O-6-methylguanine DNA methyltransferase